jgi:hypothetical protein
VQWRRAWLLHTGTVRVTVGIYRTLYWYNQHMFLYLGSPLHGVGIQLYECSSVYCVYGIHISPSHSSAMTSAYPVSSSRMN